MNECLVCKRPTERVCSRCDQVVCWYCATRHRRPDGGPCRRHARRGAKERNIPRHIETARPDLWPAVRIARFYAFVQRGDDAECWPWTGGRYRSQRHPSGTGRYRFRVAGRDFDIYAHRAAYVLAEGPIPPEHEVIHSCGNRLCCNPAHLIAGPPYVRGAQSRARGTKAGERHHGCKLTEQQVFQIRTLQGEVPPAEVAERFSVSISRIRDIWARRAWSHLPEQDEIASLTESPQRKDATFGAGIAPNQASRPKPTYT